MSERETKQVIVIRRELKMRRGKEIAQGAHASARWMADLILDGYNKKSLKEAELKWLETGTRKVTVYVQTLQELLDLREDAWEHAIHTAVIVDSGATEFHGEPTVTALAIGPDWSDRIDAVTKDLPLY